MNNLQYNGKYDSIGIICCPSGWLLQDWQIEIMVKQFWVVQNQ